MSGRPGRPSIRPLPHGLSTRLPLEDIKIIGNADTERSNQLQKRSRLNTDSIPKSATGKKSKRQTIKLGVTPFPDYDRPTLQEVNQVHRILTQTHGEYNPAGEPDIPSAMVAGCGNVPFVLEAVVRTIISSATSMTNANTAIQGLLRRFGVFNTGSYIGSVDWDQVRLASLPDLINALPGGVMPGLKADYIKNTLQAVWEENEVMRTRLTTARKSAAYSNGKVLEENLGKEKSRINRLTDMSNRTLIEYPNILTLDYMHSWNDSEVFEGLYKFNGVGPKIAACVMLFCMQRPRFPVDTHCHRLCKWLGWVPNHRVNDHKTFAHCDVRIPDELKFSLHQLMIVHGQECKRCNAKDLTIQPDDLDCPLEHLLDRVRPGNSKKRSRKEAVDGHAQEEEQIPRKGQRNSSSGITRSAKVSHKRQRTSANIGNPSPGTFNTEERPMVRSTGRSGRKS